MDIAAHTGEFQNQTSKQYHGYVRTTTSSSLTSN